MSDKLFGTDGVRGVANQYPMTAEFALKLAMAAGVLICSEKKRVAIARDTRISSPMLESALAAGFMAAGVDVLLLGVLPTPALTCVTPKLDVDMAVMITASHNPYYDNGIKLINKDGNKFSDADTAKIEEKIFQNDIVLNKDKIGVLVNVPDAVALYLDDVLKLVGDKKQPLKSLRIVLDCANGAFSKIMPEIFKSLGAGVIALACEPDGVNVNHDCGSQHIENLQKVVKESHAQMGIACDGDGDRIVVVDDLGEKVPCEQVIAYLAKVMSENSTLNGRPVVSTIVSNTGLDSYIQSLGVQYFATKVGERYVIEKMLSENGAVGGEESGHIVLGDYSKTGDALMVGLYLALAVVQSGKKVSEIFPIFAPEPTEAVNMHFEDNDTVRKIMADENVSKAAQEADDMVKKIGRVVFRASGTEPVVRIWVGGKDENLVKKAAHHIREAVKRAV